MFNQEQLDCIVELAHEVEERLADLEDPNLSDLSGTVRELCGLIEEIDLDEEDIGELIPKDLSLGETLSLRAALNEWRAKNGYPKV